MGNFVRHTSCEKCGSSDANAIYDDGSSHCFACEATVPSQEFLDSLDGKQSRVRAKPARVLKENNDMEVKVSNKPVITKEQLDEIKKVSAYIEQDFRGVRKDTYTEFNVRHSVDEDGDVCDQYYPVTQEGQIVGLKVREVPKNFRSIGRTGADCELFMQSKFNRGGKYIVITEGELDALSAYQMLNDYNKRRGSPFVTAVVSPTTGANSYKQIAAQYKFLDSFDHIIICFDNDKAGKESAEELVKYLPKGKVKMMKLNYKDPNEYLENEDEDTFVRDFYNAEVYRPVGVLGSSELYDRILEQAEEKKLPFPPFMPIANEMTAGGMPLGHIVNIAAKTGVGKCHGKGTKIRMFDMSVKNVEDIVNGDKIMGPDGTVRHVTGVTSGVDTLYRIDQNKGMSYVVNSEHILSLKHCTNGKYKKGEVVNIKVTDFLNLSKTTQGHLKGYKGDLTLLGESYDIDDMYILGLWLSEGTHSKPEFTLNNNDTQLFDELLKYSENNGYELKVYPSGYRDNCTMYSVIGGYKTILQENKLIGNKHIPREYMISDYESRLNILAGFIDGDGHLINGCHELTLKNNQLAQDIIDLARSVGLNVTDHLVFRKCQGFEGDYYRRIYISGNIDKIPNRLTRKHAGERKQIKNALHTGITVTNIGEGEYYGFELDGDHLYCLEDLTVTHNTSLVNELIYFWIFNSPYKIGIVSMELNSGQYGEVLLSRHMQRKLSLIRVHDDKMKVLRQESTVNKARELFKDSNDNDRFYLLDNRDGSLEEIQDTVEELIVSCGCRIIILDPLQDVLDGLTIDEQAVFMKWAKGIIKSHNVLLIFINHMRKTDGGAHDVNEEDIQGSSTIIKSSSLNVFMTRDKTSDDQVERNTTKVKIPKNRVCGITGPADELYYDNETHTLYNKEDYFRGRT